MRHSFTTATILGTVVLLAVLRSAAGQEFSISPVWIDLSPGETIPPDGSPEFMVNREVIDLPYQGAPAGTQLMTQPGLPYVPGPGIMYMVTVQNLTGSWLLDAVLIIENYGCFYGDPSGSIFLSDTVWNPPALATGNVPAYPLGDIAPWGVGQASVKMLSGYDLYGFDGQFNAGSIGFDSYPDVPGFSDASVLFVPEPSALCLLIFAAAAALRRRR